MDFSFLTYRIQLRFVFLFALAFSVGASGAELRRPVGPQRPMWLVHVSALDGESVTQTLDGLPEDVKPYVVLNLAMSANSDPALLDRMMGQCRDRGVWVMIQPSSGYGHYLDAADIAVYEDYYRKYPNLVGYNFCEQVWGFTADTFTERLELYCKLLEIGAKHGGYLYVNDTQSVSNNPYNTISKMKKYARYAECVRRYGQNLIYGDKTTTGLGYYDNESACFGMFLSGCAGNYAVRFDQFAWSYSGRAQLFGEEYTWQIPNSLAWFTCPESLAGMSIAEHLMMTGATVIDGPEVSTLQVMRHGRLTPGGKNVVVDAVRKVLDGTVSIPERSEVASRVKAAYVCNSTPTVDDALYTGLYSMDGDKRQNRTWLKRTGRYLTIPTFAAVPEGLDLDVVVTQTGGQSYASRWPEEADKTAELNRLYPEEYTGTMYAGRRGNRWLAYNPYVNTDMDTYADIPLQYNSCEAVSLSFTPHTFAVVSEHAGGLDIYLNNYRTDKSELWQQYPSVSSDDGLPTMTYGDPMQYMEDTFIDNPTDATLRRSVITVRGCAGRPAYTYSDRGEHPASTVSEAYADGTFTLTVMHNGPLDISLQCAGSNTGRPSAPQYAAVEDIPRPDMQAEASCPDVLYDFEDMAEGEVLTPSTQPWIAADGAGAAQVTRFGGSLMLNPTAIGSGENRVGIANLTRFGSEQDYSVTWKECVTSESKGGVLMRGKPATGGGNPGLMDGYYFQVGTDIAAGTTKVAIRRVTNQASGTTLFDDGTQGEVTITAPEAGRPRWYRATCDNNLLTLEYSDDGQTFTRTAARTDSRYPSAGVTQLLWGVGVTAVTTSYYGDIRLASLSSSAPSGITGVEADGRPSSLDNAWYTLQGVRVARPAAPGVYIRGGRKYVIKP